MRYKIWENPEFIVVGDISSTDEFIVPFSYIQAQMCKEQCIHVFWIDGLRTFKTGLQKIIMFTCNSLC